jgi:hypothetical protein
MRRGTDPVKSVEPMILELIDAETGEAHGDMNVYLQVHRDGTSKLIGTIRFHVTGFVADAVWTLRYAWQDRTKPQIAFRVPEAVRLDPLSVVQIVSIDFASDALEER